MHGSLGVTNLVQTGGPTKEISGTQDPLPPREVLRPRLLEALAWGGGSSLKNHEKEVKAAFLPPGIDLPLLIPDFPALFPEWILAFWSRVS